MLIGFIYDLYRIFRGIFKPGKIATIIQDFFFWVIIAGVAMSVLLFSTSGQLRFFSFLGFSLGVILYCWAFSSIVIRTIRKVLRIIYKSIGSTVKIICYPIKMVRTGLRKVLVPVKRKFAWIPKTFQRLRQLPKAALKRVKGNIMAAIKKK